jgi:hypothetical protein
MLKMLNKLILKLRLGGRAVFNNPGYQTLPNVLDSNTIEALLVRIWYYEANPEEYEAQLEFLYGPEPERKVQKMSRLA